MWSGCLGLRRGRRIVYGTRRPVIFWRIIATPTWSRTGSAIPRTFCCGIIASLSPPRIVLRFGRSFRSKPAMIVPCAKCQNPVEIPDSSAASDLFTCPHCSSLFNKSAPNPRLIPCKDCQQPISKTANSCPHCGRMIFPVNNLAELALKFGAAILLVAVFLSVLLFALSLVFVRR